jgi:hypothetical protein
MTRQAFYSFILICMAISLHSCHGPEYELFGYTDEIFLENKTSVPNLHVQFGKRNMTLPDSLVLNDTNNYYKAPKEYYVPLLRLTGTSWPMSQREFVDSIAKFKIFYLENKDTFFVNRKFYDGITYWDKVVAKSPVAMIFAGKSETYTATLTNDMFEKK